MYGVLSWLIFGAIAGWIASLIVDKKGRGCCLNIAIGIVGSVIGGLLFQLLGGRGVTGFNIYSLIVAVVGAVIFLGIVNWAKRKG